MINIGLEFLLKFRDDPTRIGISDPRYLQNVEDIVRDECKAFEDNLLKFKFIRSFFNQSFDAYYLMTSQLDYQSLTKEQFLIVQGQIIEVRFKISEIVYLLDKYYQLFLDRNQKQPKAYVKTTFKETQKTER